MVKKILIIDDDRELCGLLSSYLGREGFACSGAYDGQSGLEWALNQGAGFDLIILDVMLPLKNGFEVLSALRGARRTLPVIMLTAKGEPVDRIIGLEMGADDYLAKPFEPRELLARIRALARRLTARGGAADSGRVQAGGLNLDENSLKADFEGRPLNLTPVEFKVLWLLAGSAGKVVSRQTLFQEALGRREQAFDRSLDMHISRLRKKIWPEAAGPGEIKNIRGEGYLYVPDKALDKALAGPGAA
jgi:two-component system response regulator CpxR